MSRIKMSRRCTILYGVLMGMISTLILQFIIANSPDFTDWFNYNTKHYTFYFDNINTLDTGSPVLQSGIEVGKITNIRVVSEEESLNGKRMQVEVSLNEMAEVSTDSFAVIQTLGMKGETYLDISFGSGKLAAHDSKLEGDGFYDIKQHRTNFIHYRDEF